MIGGQLCRCLERQLIKEAILEFDYNKDSGPNHTFDQYYVPQCDGYDFGALGTPTQEW